MRIEAPPRDYTGAEIATAIDYNTGATALINASYTQLAPTIAVPPGGAYHLFYGLHISVTVAGSGYLSAAVRDDSAGGGGKIIASMGRGQAFVAGVYPAINDFHGHEPLPPNTDWKIYRLCAALFRDSGSLAGNVSGYGTSGALVEAGFTKQYLRAVRIG